MSHIWCDNCRQCITEGVTVVVNPIQLKTVDICINCAKYFVSEKQHPGHVGADKIDPILLKDMITSSDSGLRNMIKEKDQQIANLQQEIFMLKAQLKTQKPKENKINTFPGLYPQLEEKNIPTNQTVHTQPSFPTFVNSPPPTQPTFPTFGDSPPTQPTFPTFGNYQPQNNPPQLVSDPIFPSEPTSNPFNFDNNVTAVHPPSWDTQPSVMNNPFLFK